MLVEESKREEIEPQDILFLAGEAEKIRDKIHALEDELAELERKIVALEMLPRSMGGGFRKNMADDLYVNISGDTMTGDLNMGLFDVKNASELWGANVFATVHWGKAGASGFYTKQADDSYIVLKAWDTSCTICW